VDFKIVPPRYKDAWESTLTVENILREANQIRDRLALSGDAHDANVAEFAQGLEPNDVIVDWSMLHMGMKDRDPMQLVRLYSKHKPNSEYPVINCN
jgi:hypothetical protein